MQVIYEPKGRALEYSPLAVNLYTGCTHGCLYCYGPATLRKKPGEFHSNVQPRKDILKKLESDCKKMEGDPRQILLCFLCDPYQPRGLFDYRNPSPDSPVVEDITREALLILEKYHMNVTVLTKGGMRAGRDFDILARNGWWFGTSLSFVNDDELRLWEPGPSANCFMRCAAIRRAKLMGIKTWVSVEPVLHFSEALDCISLLSGKPPELPDIVDHWKIGKINHMPKIEKQINWGLFLQEAEEILKGKSYYIKKDLEDWRWKSTTHR